MRSISSHPYDDLKTGDKIRIGEKMYTLEVADTFMTRFYGLMGRKSLPADKALFIKPCDSIHTCFMRFPMTAIFVDKRMLVVKVVPNMAPWRLTFAHGAYGVFELAGYGGSDVKVGDSVSEIYYRLDEAEKVGASSAAAMPSLAAATANESDLPATFGDYHKFFKRW